MDFDLHSSIEAMKDKIAVRDGCGAGCGRCSDCSKRGFGPYPLAQHLYSPDDGVTKEDVQLIFEGNKLSGDVTVQVSVGVSGAHRRAQGNRAPDFFFSPGRLFLTLAVLGSLVGACCLLSPGLPSQLRLCHSSRHQADHRWRARVSSRGVRLGEVSSNPGAVVFRFRPVLPSRLAASDVQLPSSAAICSDPLQRI